MIRDSRIEQLTAMQVGARLNLPPGFHVMGIEENRALDYMADSLSLSIHGVVYGKEGPRATKTATYREWRLQRFMPKWLQRKLTVERTLTVDVTPHLVFPDMTWVPPHLGKPVRILMAHDGWD